MTEDDAKRVVQFHSWDYTRNWEVAIAGARTTLEKAESFLRPLIHYKASAGHQLAEHEKSLNSARDQLDHSLKAITVDVGVLRRHVPLLYTLRNRPWLRWLLVRVYGAG